MTAIRIRAKLSKITYPICVRHQKPRKDVRLRHFFLCDKCKNVWTKEAFDGNEPLYIGEQLNGYCMLCNLKKQVRLRIWYLCDICDRVARSIGRNHVAEKAVLDFWYEHVLPKFPYLQIHQNDVSALHPRREGDSTGEGPLDFLISDERIGKIVLGIENKTGRSSIKEMSQFQLDLSDCDSILNHVRMLMVPAYIIHAQVLELWTPPTVGFKCCGLWWSDIYLMAEHFTAIRMRRDESRGAAYFKKSAFREISTFVEDLCMKNGKLRLVEQFKREGIPQMYRGT